MKRIAYLTVFMISGTSFAHNPHPQDEWVESAANLPTKKGGGLDAKTRAILAQFANIVMGFLGIVQDPNNAANVKDRITDMVNNAVNIVNEAVKKGELSLDADEEEIRMFAKRVMKDRGIVID